MDGIGTTDVVVTTANKIKEDSLLGLLYKDVMQPSVQALGSALGGVMEFCTIPLLLCRFGSDVAKLNYRKHLDTYARKISSIKHEEAIPVNPQIGAPILEKLTYTTNEEIADLFTTLLAKASSNETINQAHPAFIQMIERLSVDEARVLKSLVNEEYIPSISIRTHLNPEEKGFVEILSNLTNIKAELLFPSNIPTYLDNLKSLGILDNSHGLYKIDEAVYQPLFQLYGIDALTEQLMGSGAYSRIERMKSYFQVTTFGKSFIDACVS